MSRRKRALTRVFASRSELPNPHAGPVGSCARHCGPNVLRRLAARQESLTRPLRALAGSAPAPLAINQGVRYQWRLAGLAAAGTVLGARRLTHLPLHSHWLGTLLFSRQGRLQVSCFMACQPEPRHERPPLASLLRCLPPEWQLLVF